MGDRGHCWVYGAGVGMLVALCAPGAQGLPLARAPAFTAVSADDAVIALDPTGLPASGAILPALGHTYSEPSAALSPGGVLVIGYNDIIGQQVGDVWTSALGMPGLTPLGAATLRTAGGVAEDHYSDPSVRWDQVRGRFVRSAVTFSFGVGENSDHTAVVVSTAADGVHWTPAVLVADRWTNAAGFFTDHPQLAVGPHRLWMQWNGFANDQEPGVVPFVQTSTDGGATWSVPRSALVDSAPGLNGAGAVAITTEGGEDVLWVPYMAGDPASLSTLTLKLARCFVVGSTVICAYAYSAWPVASWGLYNEALAWAARSERLTSMPQIASDGTRRLIMCWMDALPGRPTSIVAMTSSDGGGSWTAQTPIAPGDAGDQFLPTALWDPAGPTVCYYHHIPLPGSKIGETCARSLDGGRTWRGAALASGSHLFAPITPLTNAFFGDYFALLPGPGATNLYIYGALVKDVRVKNPYLRQSGYIQVATIARNGCMIDPAGSTLGWAALVPIGLLLLISRWRRIVCGLLLVGLCAATAEAQIVGDCNADGCVTIDELVTCVNIDLDRAPLSHCPSLACGGPLPQVFCTIRAVNAALHGCAAPEDAAWRTIDCSAQSATGCF